MEIGNTVIVKETGEKGKIVILEGIPYKKAYVELSSGAAGNYMYMRIAAKNGSTETLTLNCYKIGELCKLEDMPKEARDEVIRTTLRRLFGIEHDSEIDKGETHGEKEQKVLDTIKVLLDANYNCFDNFADDLIYHIREEKCMVDH